MGFSLEELTFSDETYRLCEVDGKKCLFHRWSEHCDVVCAEPVLGGAPGGQIKFTMGIVEFEDGSLREVPPYQIRFADGLVSRLVEDREVE